MHRSLAKLTSLTGGMMLATSIVQSKKVLKTTWLATPTIISKKNNKSGDEVLVACTNDEEKFTYFTYYSFSGRLDQLEDDGISKPKSTNTAVN